MSAVEQMPAQEAGAPIEKKDSPETLPVEDTVAVTPETQNPGVGEAGAEARAETTQSPESREISQRSAAEEVEKELNPTEELTHIGESIARNETETERLAAHIEADKKTLEGLQREFGISNGSMGERLERDEATLKWRRELQEKLEHEKEEMETAQELNEVLAELNNLPKDQLTIIIETGKGADGKPLKGPGGTTVSPDVAKELARLAEQGAKKVTKAILKTIVGLVKGVLKGVFETVKEVAS